MRIEELQFELEILEKKKFSLQLEQIFISKKIYQIIEKCTTWEEVLETVMQKLQSAVKKLDRNITQEDITALTQLKFEQIAKYNAEQSQKNIEKLTEEINKMNNFEKEINEINMVMEKYTKEMDANYKDGLTIVNSFLTELEKRIKEYRDIERTMQTTIALIGHDNSIATKVCLIRSLKDTVEHGLNKLKDK